ncbi:MAG: hypothetical protein ACFFEE_10435, partial [Candidatus Thorarchaeota archaeon]
MNLQAIRGRNQQGFCFVSSDVSPGIYHVEHQGRTMYAEVRFSEKVPNGTIIIDSRVSDILRVVDRSEILLKPLSSVVPTCNEIRLGVVSTKDLDNEKVAHAMSKRIDDFQKYLDGLILHQDLELPISELGINLHILSMKPIDSTTKSARISWEELLKINLVSIDSNPCNLCILVETAAATQITDVDSFDQKITRHEAILSSLDRIEGQFSGFGQNVLFSGVAFSNEVFSFITF